MRLAASQPPPHLQLSGREQPLQEGGNIKRPKKMWNGVGCEISLLVNLK